MSSSTLLSKTPKLIQKLKQDTILSCLKRKEPSSSTPEQKQNTFGHEEHKSSQKDKLNESLQYKTNEDVIHSIDQDIIRFSNLLPAADNIEIVKFGRKIVKKVKEDIENRFKVDHVMLKNFV